MSAGQVMVGGELSTTVTVALHESDAPLMSVTVNVTVVTPRSYGPAGDWRSVMESPSGSNEPSSMDVVAVHEGPAGTTTFVQTATGEWFWLILTTKASLPPRLWVWSGPGPENWPAPVPNPLPLGKLVWLD